MLAIPKACDGTFRWDEGFYKPSRATGPVHGAFYFDAYRNWDKRGSVQPISAHSLSASKELYKTISLPQAASSCESSLANALRNVRPYLMFSLHP